MINLTGIGGTMFDILLMVGVSALLFHIAIVLIVNVVGFGIYLLGKLRG